MIDEGQQKSPAVGTPAELRAKIKLTKAEIAHLWNGGILSLKVEGPGTFADLEVRCGEVQPERGVRILIKRVEAE